MATTKPRKGPCNPACTTIVRFMTDKEVPPNVGVSIPGYKSVDGYRHLNVFVRFNQETSGELPVDLGVLFAFDAQGTLSARRYVNLEANVPGPQSTNFIEVSGSGSWHGSPHNISSYMARLPVMGPFAWVVVYNRAPVKRVVTVWGYLVS